MMLVLSMGTYLVLRAMKVPLVFDEATTYFLYVKNGDFLPGVGFWSANNHFLNSFFSWLFTVNQEWPSQLRLRNANILAFVLFAGWLFRIAKVLKSNLLRFLLLPAIFSVHYMMEFFAYARGYGLALAFLTGALWFLYQWYSSRKIGTLYKLALCVFLMVAASLSTLPAAGMIVLAAIFVAAKSAKKWWVLLLPFLIMATSLLAGSFITEILSARGELYYGGEEGLWFTTVRSLQEVFFNTQGGWADLVFILNAASLCAFTVFGYLYFSKKNALDFRFFPLLMVLVALLFYVFAHLFLGVLFPIDRAVLYLVLLVIIALFFVADVWAEQIKKLWPLLFLLPLIVFPATFFQKANLHSCSANSWSVEQIPESFDRKLGKSKATYGGYFLRQPQWNFYYTQYPKPKFSYTATSPKNTMLDYVLAADEHLPNYAALYRPIDSNGSGNVFLLQRNNFLKRVAIDSVSLNLNDTITGDLILSTKNRSEFKNVKALEIQFEMESIEPQFSGVLGISGVDTENNTLFWKDVRIAHLNYKTNFRENYSAFVPLDELPQSTETLTVFLWNEKQEKVIVYEVSVKYVDLIEP